MRKVSFLLLLSILSAQALPSASARVPQQAINSVQPSQTSGTRLVNRDVLEMLRAKLAPEAVVGKIASSACDFDTSPEAVGKLKAEGVPDTVIVAMVTASKAPAAAGSPPGAGSPGGAARTPEVVRVKVPDGILVEVESAYTINSQDVRTGDLISFRVINPVRVSGATVIEGGATATGRVVKASRGGHFGRAGRLAWEMREVTASDGTRLPLRSAGRVVGDSKGAKVATQTVLVGVLLGPFAPLSLLHGFKRGENAYVPAGKRFEVYVSGETFVTAPASPR